VVSGQKKEEKVLAASLGESIDVWGEKMNAGESTTYKENLE